MCEGVVILDLIVKDIRFPTSLNRDGSDAMHKNPDYSCAYVIIVTNTKQRGYGMTFTLGRGTEVVISGIESLKNIVIGQEVKKIYENFGDFWRKLTSDDQLRWLGPEKGVMHLATAAIINALWDLWARLEKKPVWKLLVDLTPEQLTSAIDFRYITDVITKEEAIKMLKEKEKNKAEREKDLRKNGYPAYTTQVGWLGYSTEKVKRLCRKYLDLGFNAFKVKVGLNLEEDKKRCAIIRDCIGPSNVLMMDANQVWDVNEAIHWMEDLAQFKPLWIEEPTSPDDVLGHAKIAKALKEYDIGVATGEMCCNRVMFKQFMQAEALEFCQIDSARVGGINELLAIYLMAEKLKVKVCPHAGGVGLCEMVQHLQFWDYISLSGSKDGKYIEYVDQQHIHFVTPVVIECVQGQSVYLPTDDPGYSCELLSVAINEYKFPEGTYWQKLTI